MLEHLARHIEALLLFNKKLKEIHRDPPSLRNSPPLPELGDSPPLICVGA